jgi:cell division protein FtsW
MVLSRSERSHLTEWWFTVDRTVLGLSFLLLTFGIIMLLSASPPVAMRKDLPHFFFVQRQLVFAVFGSVLLLAVSFLSVPNIRRLSLALFILSLLSMVGVLLFGPEINGAQRWIRIAGVSLQPSEILKPAFIILTAWAFSEGLKSSDVPANSVAIGFYVISAILLILQPDFGQTLLLTATWVGMFFLAGLAWGWVIFFLFAGLGVLVLGYQFLPHVTSRIDHFLDPSGENYQIARALEAFRQAGWFGRGPGEGSLAEQFLPDAHNDFIFAAIADEFGILACLLLLFIFGGIVFLSLMRSKEMKDPFIRLAVSGMMLLFALQTSINMSVNLGLIPAKGMTLPFISYGGTSLLGTALLLGMTLALTRRHPLSTGRFD